MKTILVVGGAGYIGSHTVIDLRENNYNVIILDNFSNSSEKVIERLNDLTNSNIKCYKGDAKNYEFVKNIFIENKNRCSNKFCRI